MGRGQLVSLPDRQEVAVCAGLKVPCRTRKCFLLKEFGGLTADLIFLEDGLHAVVSMERKYGEAAGGWAVEPKGE